MTPPLCKTCGGRGVVPVDRESSCSTTCPDCDGTGIDFREQERATSRKERPQWAEQAQDED